MITVKRLTLEDARIMLEAAEAKAKEIGALETICVCDDGGHPIALHRMTGARLTGVEIAVAKAFTAAGHRRATHKFNAPPAVPPCPATKPSASMPCIRDASPSSWAGFPSRWTGR
jgi:uncharacterized protein GlcG (DUF336 family)